MHTTKMSGIRDCWRRSGINSRFPFRPRCSARSSPSSAWSGRKTMSSGWIWLSNATANGIGSRCGGMVGANRLAMEAWPLFQSVAVRGELQTVGFQGTQPSKGICWTWPLWTVPIALCDVTPILNLDAFQGGSDRQSSDGRELLIARGIGAGFRLRRILVEKTPNFTLPIAMFTGPPLARPTESVHAAGVGG